MLVVDTSIVMSALLTCSVRRTWIAVSNLNKIASQIETVLDALDARSAQMAAQAQTTTAHAALLSGSVEALRRDLAFPDGPLPGGLNHEFLEGDD